MLVRRSVFTLKKVIIIQCTLFIFVLKMFTLLLIHVTYYVVYSSPETGLLNYMLQVPHLHLATLAAWYTTFVLTYLIAQ